MEPNLAEPVSKPTNFVPIIVGSVLVAALAAGGGVYAYQKSQSDKTQADLQSQITSLQQAKTITASATPAPSAVPTSTTTSTATSSPTTAAPALTVSQLMNFTYNDLNGKSHTLKNGTVTYPAYGATGTMTILQNIGTQQIDLNGDGSVDSVLVIKENDGGTGYYSQLVSVLNVNGKPVLSGQHRILDDRSTVKNLTINNGLIVVDGLVHGANQSFADLGNQPKTETYKWVNGTLVVQ